MFLPSVIGLLRNKPLMDLSSREGLGYGVFNTAEMRGYGQPQYFALGYSIKTVSAGKEKHAVNFCSGRRGSRKRSAWLQTAPS
jgi:hypothetical protein